MTKRVALYLRVSTDRQTVENQRRELAEVAERSGWTVVATFEDSGVSGSKGRDKRPGFDALLKAATRRQFDLIASWSVDRLGRSLQDLLGFLGELKAVGCGLYLHQQAIDTTTPAGRAFFQMAGVFAEFERAMIVERVKAGLERAKAEDPERRRARGKKAIGRPGISPQQRRAIADGKTKGLSVRATARNARVSVGTVHKEWKLAVAA